ncbi:copper resistance protein CopC [Nocardiopsis sp. NPDC006938]|uniref:copper resistance CopC family protein n=1 Tax=Nocardiopsis sp. NPDC006938 TaxID=3364337 RepID=UPI0036AB457E
MRGIPPALCATAAVLLLTPAPALAHDTLIATTPEADQRLRAAPREVVLTFSGEVMDVSTAVVVLDSRAEPVDTTAPLVEGADVSVEPLDELADGGYAVRWRVVSGDGHPVSGAFDFHVGEGGPPPPPLDAVPAQASGEESAPGDAGVSTPAGRPPRGAVLALVGALAGLALYAIALRVRRAGTRQRRSATRTTPVETETR